MLWISIPLSIAIAALVIIQQVKCGRKTSENIDIYRHFFKAEGAQCIYRVEKQQRVVAENATDTLRRLIDNINDYLCQNQGTADFSIIQNKTDRAIKQRYDTANAQISFPTHYGLMGTFLGVFVGLMSLVVFPGGLAETTNVISLIAGVAVAMLTSLVGLFLSNKNTRSLELARVELNADKNEFFDYLQNHLLPYMGSSLVDSLRELKGTIGSLNITVGRFDQSYSQFISDFDETFNKRFSEIIARFSGVFSKNIELITSAVAEMGKDISVIMENTDTQKELLEELQSGITHDTLWEFNEAAKKFEDIRLSLDEIKAAYKSISTSATKINDKQSVYNSQLEVPQAVAERLNNILDRISTFEENINRVGEQIGAHQLYGSDIAHQIAEQIKTLDKIHQHAENYTEDGVNTMQQFYAEQKRQFEKLLGDYNALIEENTESLKSFFQDSSKSLERLKARFDMQLATMLDIESLNQNLGNIASFINMPLSQLADSLQKAASDQGQQVSSAVRSNGDVLARTNSILNEIGRNIPTDEAISDISQVINDCYSALTEIKEQIESAPTAITETIHKQTTTLGEMNGVVVTRTKAIESKLTDISKSVLDNNYVDSTIAQEISNIFIQLKEIQTALNQRFERELVNKQIASIVGGLQQHATNKNLPVKQK